jgi:single-strand DNA-binding protein
MEMAWLNKVMIIGNVGTEPEMRFTPNGTPVTSFRLATNRLFTTSDGERRKETEWFDVITWRRQAESCNQFLSKGQRVYVEGRLRTRSWEGQDGRTQFRVEIQADRVIFLDRRPVAPSELGPEEELVEQPVEPEELPF